MSLEVLGLDPQAEVAYRRLLSDRAAPVPLPVLGRLRGLGLVDPDGAPSAPSVLEELADATADDLDRRQREVARTRSDIASLFTSLPHPDEVAGAAIGVELVPAVEDVRARLDELSFFARTCIYAVQPQSSSPAARAAAEPMDRRSRRRHLDLRVLTVAGDRPPVRPAGVDVRTTRDRLERLILVDEHTAVLPEDGGGALVVTAPPLVRRLSRLFAQWWAAATDPDTPHLTEAELALLRRLADGSTDELIARDLGISTRQLRRRVTALLDRLGVPTRVAAGVAVGRAGWL